MLHHPNDTNVDQQAAAEEAFQEEQGVSSHKKKSGTSKANARSRSRKKGESAAATSGTASKEGAVKPGTSDLYVGLKIQRTSTTDQKHSSPLFRSTLSPTAYPPTSPVVPPQTSSFDSPALVASRKHPTEGGNDRETTDWAFQPSLGESPPVELGAPLIGELPPFRVGENDVSRVESGKERVEQDVGRHGNNRAHAHDVLSQNRQSLPDELRGGFSNASPSISPRAAFRLPVPRKNGYHSFGDYLGEGNMGKDSSTTYNHRYPYGSPIPHHLQNHPPKQPVVDAHLSQLYGDDRPLGTVTYCGFDTLGNAGDVTSLGIDNVLILGCQQRLAILKVEKERNTRIGGLAGLRGEVLVARVLPCLSRSVTETTCRPLIALVVHGPADRSHVSQQSRPVSSVSQDSFDASKSTLLAMQEVAKGPEPPATHYQTTVEVYSLKDQRHVKTLYSTAPKKIELPSKEHLVPSGTLGIQTKGKFITVSSGDSGEVYIFEQTKSANGSECDFACIGKTWTSIPVRKPRSWSSSHSESDTTGESSQSHIAETEAAMVSLSGRWLAIIPPLPPSRSTIDGKVDRTTLKYNPPGLSSHTCPSQPTVTCEIRGPAGDSALNKIARDVTQEVIRGAKYLGDQSMQAFRNYWYKPADALPQDTLADHDNVHGPFPPTHANDGNNRPNKGPVVVSILDLQQLSDNQKTALSPQPVATFALRDGCSFLSFVPSGLALLSASTNGDVWHIWDLMRMMHGKMGLLHDDPQEPDHEGPSVRQIKQFTRATVAKIIDVIWTEPRGEQFALVTARGTVHIFSLPPTAFRWPPLRQIVQNRTARRRSGEDPDVKTPDRPSTASSTFSSAMTMVSSSTQPIVAAVRGRPASISNAVAGFKGLNFAAGAGAKGGKVIAASVNRGIGVAASTVNTVRHMGENRLTLPFTSSSLVLPNCVRWMSGKSRGQLAVAGGGILQIYTVNEGGSGQRRPSVLDRKPAEFKLSSSVGKTVRTGDVPEHLMPGYWPLLANPTPAASKQSNITHPLSFAEIETNAPYQPFHTDRRVNLRVYADTDYSTLGSGSQAQYKKSLVSPSTSHNSSPWVFGEDIPTYQISRGSADTFAGAEHDLEVGDGASRQVESQVDVGGGGFGEGGHVVVTSRRKKARAGMGNMGVEEVDAEFFEDDCEVVDFAADRV